MEFKDHSTNALGVDRSRVIQDPRGMATTDVERLIEMKDTQSLLGPARGIWANQGL